MMNEPPCLECSAQEFSKVSNEVKHVGDQFVTGAKGPVTTIRKAVKTRKKKDGGNQVPA